MYCESQCEPGLTDARFTSGDINKRFFKYSKHVFVFYQKDCFFRIGAFFTFLGIGKGF